MGMGVEVGENGSTGPCVPDFGAVGFRSHDTGEQKLKQTLTFSYSLLNDSKSSCGQV